MTYDDGASREAFDLHNPACRRNVLRRFWSWRHWGWKQVRTLSFWKLVWTDTRNRVCSSKDPTS